MEDQRFDHLSRRLAGVRSRRQALKAIAGAVAGVVAGSRTAAAQSCTPQYGACQADGQCCSGSVCQYGLCMPGCRIDGTFVNAWMSPPGDICAQCLPELSTSSWSPANEGMSCWSGDPNAGATFCQSGECRANGPSQCPPPPPCYTDELIDPATCAYAAAEAGTVCGGQAMCHGGFFQPADTCDGNGFCVGGGSQTVACAPYRCGTGACTSSCAEDVDCAPGAYCDEGLCASPAELGQPCDDDRGCRSGICVEGICCNEPCEGLCGICSAETGGHCRPVSCDDGLSCTSGVCNDLTGECEQTIEPGACLIDGVCYDDGARKPGSSCEVCDAAASSTDWSWLDCPAGSGCLSGACTADIQGEITDEQTQFGVCASVNGDFWRTDSYTFVHSGGALRLGVRALSSSNGTLTASYLDLYTTYTPATPCEGLIADNKGGGCGHDSLLDLEDLAAGTYTAVVSPSHVDVRGTYLLTFGQGAAC